MKQTILVVGGLAAGPSAASKAKRVNPDAEVILFEKGEHVSYGICEVPYYVGGAVRDLGNLMPFDAAKLGASRGITVKIGHSVEEIQPTKKKVVVRDLDRDKQMEYSYDRLILATGSRPRALGIEGVTARNVFRVKSLSDGIALKKFLDERKPKKGVIVGAGYVGMEMCEALIGKGIEVELLHLHDLPMSGLEEETSKAVLEELLRNGVRFRPRQNVKYLERTDDGQVRSVVTETGSCDCDVLILAIGVEPNTDLALGGRIRIGRNSGILTDERQTTSIDSIFAAGDCCETKNIVTGKHSYMPLATYASRQGRVAGENAVGGRAVFKGAIRAIAVRIFTLEVAQVGISSVEATKANIDFVKVQVTSDTKVGYFPGNEKMDIVAIADRRTGRLLGANVSGGVGSVLRANVLGFAIQQKMTVAQLSQHDMIYSPPFSPLWDPVLVLANQLKKKIDTRV